MRTKTNLSLRDTPALTPTFGHNSGPIKIQQQGDYVPPANIRGMIEAEERDDTYRAPFVWTCPYGI